MKFVVVAEIVAVLATSLVMTVDLLFTVAVLATSLVMTVDLLFTVAFATCVSPKK